MRGGRAEGRTQRPAGPRRWRHGGYVLGMRRIGTSLAVFLAAGLTLLAPAAGAQTVGRSDGQTVGRVTTDDMAAKLDSLLARMADWGALIQAESQWRFARLG